MLAPLTPQQLAAFLKQTSERELEAIEHDWGWWGRPNQQAPKGDWRTWLLLAGRGFGKTRSGAECIRDQVIHHRRRRIALVAPMRPLASLAPYASNPRTHTPAQIDLIARSIEAFGFTNPLLVDGERGIIAGHGRYQAAQKLRLAEVPTIELRRPNGHAGQSRSIASTKPTASSPRSTSTVRERLMRRIAR
ncbi:MAG TPA: ParB N-terminal domain-containing protein, partial [Stellaceae bacterium]|nr:ParB N-terminal domain-containing protein [Stellaceae bacterium]